MDAYELMIKIRKLWMENYNMNSGSIQKDEDYMAVKVNGKAVTNAEFKNGCIELEVEND